MSPKSAALMTTTFFILAGCNVAGVTGVDEPALEKASGALNVSSGSFVTTGGAEIHMITLIVDGFTEKWSFNAKGEDAKGKFNVIFRLGGETAHVNGDVLCYNISGNRARLAGVVTSSSSPVLVGTHAVWSVEDNGEGSNGLQPDLATPYELMPVGAEAYCGVPATWMPEMLPVETGNVQVHE